MSTGAKISTIALLGWQFFLHIFRKVILRRKSPGYDRFLENFREDRIVPFSEVERDRLHHYGGCIACGICDPICPTLKVSPNELFPGPADMAVCISRNPVEIGLNTSPFLSVLCKACDHACPEKVPIAEIITYMRRKARLTHPELLPQFYQTAIENLESTGNVFGSPKPAGKPGTDKILYWRGCRAAARIADGQPDTDALLLDNIGVKYTTISESCCGGLPGQMGLDYDDSSVMETISETGAEQVVTSCPLCYKALRDALPDVKVRHVLEIASGKLNGGKPLAGQKVAYHDPCLLGRGLGVYDLPREIITRLGAELTPLENEREEALCCGAGGALPEVDSALADKIARVRIEEVLESGATILLTACGECARQLAKVVDEKENLAVKTISEIATG